MVEAGYTNVSGIEASTVGASKTSGTHPRTKFRWLGRSELDRDTGTQRSRR
jgi:hypothetical protein